MLTIAGVTFTDTETAEITADLERYERETGDGVDPFEGMTTTELYRHEKSKRHDKLMAEAKAEFDQWDQNRDPKAWMKPKARLFDTNALRGE